MVKPKKTKLLSTPPKPRKKLAPSSGAQKPVPPPNPQSKSSGGVEKRKKGNPERFYVVATAEEEVESDEAVREVKKTSTSSRVVKKPPSGEGNYTIVPPITLSQIVDIVVREGNLKHLSECGWRSSGSLVAPRWLGGGQPERNTRGASGGEGAARAAGCRRRPRSEARAAEEAGLGEGHWGSGSWWGSAAGSSRGVGRRCRQQSGSGAIIGRCSSGGDGEAGRWLNTLRHGGASGGAARPPAVAERPEGGAIRGKLVGRGQGNEGRWGPEGPPAGAAEAGLTGSAVGGTPVAAWWLGGGWPKRNIGRGGGGLAVGQGSSRRRAAGGSRGAEPGQWRRSGWVGVVGAVGCGGAVLHAAVRERGGTASNDRGLGRRCRWWSGSGEMAGSCNSDGDEEAGRWLNTLWHGGGSGGAGRSRWAADGRREARRGRCRREAGRRGLGKRGSTGSEGPPAGAVEAGLIGPAGLSIRYPQT
ncbi:uncharacterized protein LOC131860118 [Cryptomeria japonica]|uniref:uncharacterized protein LOC131860118 n=1 Tax=Cryptomeria japonica TaxID=3369 RepID=UPI0027DA67FD|nr:uncharacterized protein LOC131860118 [Cryptomeria japonica]